MSDTRSTRELFKAWRGGDAAAGQAMAQRFADWYYAIATSRLGEGRGRGPCDAACQRFGQGVVEVTESRALVGWAHQIIQDEVTRAGGVARDGDEANAYTNGTSPKSLLARAREALPAEVGLLELVYRGGASEAEIDDKAKDLGGNPIGVLTARYRVKRWLKDHAGVPFSVTPDQPILDRAPLPLYESMQMASDDEVVQFEQWMLTDIDLCRDIAEFATFSVALRGGLAGVAPAAGPRPAPRADGTPATADAPASGPAVPKVLVAAGLVAIVLVVLATAAVAVVKFLL